MALNRQEMTARFLSALAILGATHTVFRSMTLREHQAAQTVLFPLLGAACHSRAPGARPVSQLSDSVVRHRLRRDARGKPAALHGSEGQHSNRLLKKEKYYPD